MRTLYVAAVVGFVALCVSACTSGSTLPQLSPAGAIKTHSHQGLNPNDCPGDSGGGMTGDGQPCPTPPA